MENGDMNKTTPQLLLEYMNSSLEQIICLTRELVEIETPTLQTETHPEIHKVLEREFSASGYRCFRKSGSSSGGLLFCCPEERRRGDRFQLMLGHCDTVWDIGTIQKEVPLVEDGNILRGPGIYDMKTGLAQIVFALRALKELGLKPSLTPAVLVTSDEELGSDDSIKWIRLLAKGAERVLIPEPSYGEEGKLKTSRRGVGRYEIRITGKAAHSGLEPEKGISAIVVLADVIKELNALNDYPQGISVNVGVVEGGTRENVIPAESRAMVDVRVRTTADAKRIDQVIRALEPSLPGASIDISGGIDRPPMERTEANQRLWKKAYNAGRKLGLNLEEVESGGASDGNFTSEFAATLDGLGAVGGGAHALHEFIRTDMIAERAALLALLLLEEA